MAFHPVVAKVVILIVAGFSDLLPITVTSNPLAIMDLVPEISRMDPDTFILVRGSYFPRSILVLGENPILFLNFLISLPHSHLASFSILFISLIFILSN